MPEWFDALQRGLIDFLQANQYIALALYVGIEEPECRSRCPPTRQS